MSTFSSREQYVTYTPKPSSRNKYPEKESVRNDFAYAFNQMQVGDYMQIRYYSHWNSKYERNEYSDPIVVKIVEKRNIFHYSVKVQMASGKVIDLFGKKNPTNKFNYPYLNEEFLRIVLYETNAGYSSLSEVGVVGLEHRKDYILYFFETNARLKEALEEYLGTLVTEKGRQRAKELMEEEKLEKKRQAEERQREIEKQKEQERQAGEEADELFNSMRK